MARFCTLCSGSSGNCTFIGASSERGVLIDAGTNAKKLTESLKSLSLSPECVEAIFITHEHADHISALRVLAGRYKIPVYATDGTVTAMRRAGILAGDFPVNVMPAGSETDLKGIKVRSFATSHDSAESCGYTVCLPDERRVSVLTDTGYVTAESMEACLGSDLILLESNHDDHMLSYGRYPTFLKDRISSRTGHLSNEECAAAAVRFVGSGTSRLVLAHLSRENNTPAKARAATLDALSKAGFTEGLDFMLSVAPVGCCEGQVIF